MKKTGWLTLILIMMVGVSLLSPVANAKFVKQRHGVIQHPNSHIKILNNHIRTIHNKPTYLTGLPIDFISSTRGNMPMHLGTYLALPSKWPAPQSLVVTPDGRYAYVLYNASGNYSFGSEAAFVAKYQLPKRGKYDFSTNNLVQTGSVFNSGNGKQLAYDSRHKRLWVSSTVNSKVNMLQQISLKTLLPSNQLDYQLPKHGDRLSSTLTFDQKGNAYSYGIMTGKKKHRSMIRPYRGTVTANRVKFRPLSIAIRHTPGSLVKALAYNPSSKRLTFVEDDAILTLPLNKQATVHNLHSTIFNSKRNFKGFSWDRHNYGYLLLSQSPEIMRTARY